MRKEIKTDKAPLPVGPYSQAIIGSGEFLFISEMIPFTPEGSLAGEDIESQTKQVLENIKNIIEEAGCTLENVVKTTVFLKDLNDFSKMNDVYAQYFGSSRPARTTVEVSKIPKGALIGIDAIAIVKEKE